jgi:hypothetical protein
MTPFTICLDYNRKERIMTEWLQTLLWILFAMTCIAMGWFMTGRGNDKDRRKK